MRYHASVFYMEYNGKVQVSCFMDIDDKDRLRLWAARERMPVSVLVRRVLLTELERNEDATAQHSV